MVSPVVMFIQVKPRRLESRVFLNLKRRLEAQTALCVDDIIIIITFTIIIVTVNFLFLSLTLILFINLLCSTGPCVSFLTLKKLSMYSAKARPPPT